MKICIIGCGNLGCAIAYTLLCTHSGNAVSLHEPYGANRRRATGEFWDLLPVAKATGNTLSLAKSIPPAEVYIVTSGLPRTDPKQPKSALFGVNLGIVSDSLRGAKKGAIVYVATNPPKEICEVLVKQGIDARPLRKCTDSLRGRDAKNINARAFKGKGFTEWTPAWAMVKGVMG